MSLTYLGRTSGPNGDFMGDGLDHLLEETELDALEVLLRELGQNAWDARQSESLPVRFDIELRHLDDRQRAAIRDEILRDTPEHLLGKVSRLGEYLAAQTMPILTFTDRNTTGLTGPSRSGSPGDNHDFANLVFNMGARRDKRQGGGTHGFGKLIAYAYSQCRTIIIHTSSTDELGKPVERLIASAVTPSYDDGSSQYVGRHWWGAVDDGIVEPVTGATARTLASAIGLPTLDEHEKGTTVAVLDPRLVNDNAEATVDLLAQAVTRHLWPKLVPLNEGEAPPMEFGLRLDGKEQTILDPHRTEPFAGMVRALQAVRANQGRSKDTPHPFVQTRSIDRGRRHTSRDGTHLGFLAVTDARSGPIPFNADRDPENPHHVARMRAAELIVDYLPCGETPSGPDGRVGVFICNPDIDDDFARSEPATHDRWNHTWPRNYNEDPGDHAAARSNVKVAEQRIRGIVDEIFAPSQRSLVVPASGTGVVSQRLAGLISAPHGSGAGLTTSRKGTSGNPGPKPSRPQRPRVSEAGSALSEQDGEMVRSMKWQIENPLSQDAVFRLRLEVVTADGRPEDKHEVGPLPSVRAFRLNSVDSDWESIVVAPGQTASAEVEVHQPSDTAIAVRLELV